MILGCFQNLFLALASGGCWLSLSCPCAGEEVDSAKQAYSAEALRKTLDPFYKQHIVADGLVVAGSEKVSLPALREVGYLAKKLLANRPDVMSALCE